MYICIYTLSVVAILTSGVLSSPAAVKMNNYVDLCKIKFASSCLNSLSNQIFLKRLNLYKVQNIFLLASYVQQEHVIILCIPWGIFNLTLVPKSLAVYHICIYPVLTNNNKGCFGRICMYQIK